MDQAVPRTAVANQSLYVNRAYSQGDYECGDDCISLDLHASAVTTVTLKKKRNMRAFRASWCDQLTSASFEDMPALEVVDISMCKYLETVSFKSCHKLRTLDVSGTSIKSLKGINSIECIISGFSPFVFGGSQRFPNLLFLNATVGDLRFKNYPALEVLSVKSDIPLKLSVISAHPSLRVVSLKGTGYIIDSVAPSTKLRVIEGYIAQEKSAQDTSNLLKEAGIYAVFREIDESGAKFDPAMLDGLKAVEAHKLLWGPWGVPSVDTTPYPDVTPCVTPPPSCNVDVAVDAVVGTIFGSAVGDMIGLGTEFLTEPVANTQLLGPMNITWSHPRLRRHTARFVKGVATDDTSQSLLIMRSLVAANSGKRDPVDNVTTFETNGVRVDTLDLGQRLLEWVYNGHQEHNQSGGMGCGATTYHVLTHSEYTNNPIAAAHDTWIRSGRTSAPNGSVMRIAPSGCMAFWDEEVVKLVSDKCGRVTHADPRCVYCAICAALIISRIIQERTGLKTGFDVDATLEEAFEYVPDVEEYRNVINEHTHAKTLEELELSGNEGIGYCLKTFGSAVWALRHCESFAQGMEIICRKAGDADTNAAVVCAFLGAKFGLSGIPREYFDYMFMKAWLWRETKSFMNLMGLDPPPLESL